MPSVRLRKRLLQRLVAGANGAGEIALALLMTAGVAHCGGKTEGKSTRESSDASQDGGLGVEAASYDGPIMLEVANFPDTGPMVEAPAPADASSDRYPSPIIEAPPPVVEAAIFPDAGSDAHLSPMIEAPAPAPIQDSGSDAHYPMFLEAAN